MFKFVAAAPPPPAGVKDSAVGVAGMTAANGLAGLLESSVAIVTVNDCVTGVLVPSLAVTVTVTVPVAAVGALICSTPPWLSLMIEAEVIVTGVWRYSLSDCLVRHGRDRVEHVEAAGLNAEDRVAEVETPRRFTGDEELGRTAAWV